MVALLDVIVMVGGERHMYCMMLSLDSVLNLDHAPSKRMKYAMYEPCLCNNDSTHTV